MENSVSIEWVAGFVVSVVSLVFALSWRQNQHRDRIHERIDKAEDKSELRSKELEEKLSADRLQAAKDYVSHEHLEKYVRVPMKEGFEELKRLINKVSSR